MTSNSPLRTALVCQSGVVQRSVALQKRDIEALYGLGVKGGSQLTVSVLKRLKAAFDLDVGANILESLMKYRSILSMRA